MKKINNFVLFSRHPSHSPLRKVEFNLPVLTCMRLGSITKGKNKYVVEINSPESVKISANKRLMKQKFVEAGVKTANWYTFKGNTFLFQDNINLFVDIKNLTYPIIAKNIFGSRGTGNYKLNNEQELNDWLKKKEGKLDNYIFEAFFKKGREYRLHITAQGCFYACRKMLKKDAKEKWHRHDENCVWIKEENPLFDKPINWDLIVADCVKALKAIGADVLAFDVKVQTAKDKKGNVREKPEWILIESASAPSFGDITLEKYVAIIPEIVKYKLTQPVNPEPIIVVEPSRYCDRKQFKEYYNPKIFGNTNTRSFDIFDDNKNIVYAFCINNCYAILFHSFQPKYAGLHEVIYKKDCPYPFEFIQLWVSWMNSCGFYVQAKESVDSYEFIIDFKKIDKKIAILSTCILLRYLSENGYNKIPAAVEKEMRKTDDFIQALATVHIESNMNKIQPYYSIGHGLMYNKQYNQIDTKEKYLTKLAKEKSIYVYDNGIIVNEFYKTL